MTDPPATAPWPSFTEEEVEAVTRVLRSNRVNYWTGEEGRQFEAEFADWVGTRHAVALANGTLALDVALKVLGIGRGDEVIVTPRSFMASVSCVVTAGAVPVFADVDPASGNLTAETIAAVLTPRTRAVIVVHLAGWPCDMDPILELARRHGVKVIEDCAQAHGARYKGRSVGAIGDIGAWSFCQDKIMSTGGEGGMVTTDDPELWARIWAYKDHGKSHDAVYNRTHPPGFRWLIESFGTNWRMPEMQAALGRIQLRRMADWTASRQRNAAALIRALAPFAGPDGILRLPELACGGCGGAPGCAAGCQHAYYRLYAYLRPERLPADIDRNEIARRLSAAGLPAMQGSCSEIYRERAFDGTGWRPAAPLPVAAELGRTSLAFLVHPTLTEAHMVSAAGIIVDVLGAVQPSSCSA